ncbi:MAG: UMP kinase [bacterium JZ-2024 1]
MSDESSRCAYRRILLKLSGEVLAGPAGWGIDYAEIRVICEELVQAHQMAQTAVVIGGGNIFRGLEAARHGVDRVTADYAGMLATVMNSLVLQSVLESMGVQTRVQTAFEIRTIAEPYIRRRAIRHLEKGRLVIFSGGTGRPYFSTDTTAALLATEIQADILLKATKVDGVYTRDPAKDGEAKFIKSITYREMLEKDLRIMDSEAITISRDNNIPIRIFNLKPAGNLMKVLKGEEVGSLIHG